MNQYCSKPVFSVKAPGRICLLGEHQDYLGLEVISGAMNLCVQLTAEPSDQKRKLHVQLQNTGENLIMDTSEYLEPDGRNYLQSGLNVMLSKGCRFTSGYNITVSGDLPIGKGVSSSSALCVGWIKLLAAIADKTIDLDPLLTAQLAFESEVVRFGEPGGMQDHLASAIGGLLHLNFRNTPDQLPEIKHLNPIPAGFLLVDSGSSKDTLGMISRIRNTVHHQYKSLFPGNTFDPGEIRVSDLPNPEPDSAVEFKELRGTLENLALTRKTVSSWPVKSDEFHKFLPPLINTHHQILSSCIGSSTPAIDKCIGKCLDAGASAGKVIGSGGGGCILVYAPKNTDRVCRNLNRDGITYRKVHFSSGVSLRSH